MKLNAFMASAKADAVIVEDPSIVSMEGICAS